MVSAQDVIYLYKLLESHGIQSWLSGGWGIDALLGSNTRPHKDLDIFMLVDDVNPLNTLLGEYGYSFKKLWSENLFTVDSAGNKIATGYVLCDTEGHEVDVHAFRFDTQANGIPAWQVEDGFIFTPHDLSSMGTVNGLCVRCQSAENQMLCHTGYAIPDHQWPDLDALHEKLGIEFPEEIAAQHPSHIENRTTMTGSIGLIAAMPIESKALLCLVTGVKHAQFNKLSIDTFTISKHTCVLITSGMGSRRAGQATQILAERYDPKLLISFGIAGAVEEDLEIGDVVLAEVTCRWEHGKAGPLTQTSLWPEAARNAAHQLLVSRGKRLITGTAITTVDSQVAEEQLIGIAHPVLEMETAGIALVAAQKGLPLLSLRAISDGPCHPIPFDLGEMMDEDANFRIVKMISAIFRKPQILILAGQVKRNSQLAAESAALALLAALKQLDAP